jgi:hypothetical protein
MGNLIMAELSVGLYNVSFFDALCMVIKQVNAGKDKAFSVKISYSKTVMFIFTISYSKAVKFIFTNTMKHTMLLKCDKVTLSLSITEPEKNKVS